MTMTSKWLLLAVNEYKVNTARIRSMRRYLPFLVVLLLMIHILVIAPAAVGSVLDDAASLLLSRTAVAGIQVALFTIFSLFLIMPVATFLREADTARIDILLAAPVKPGDLLLGEFLGELPFCAILITVLSGLFTAVLEPMGLNIAQILVIIMIFVVTSISGLWIGTVIAALLRTWLAKLAGGRDLGGGIAMLVPLPVVAFAYAAWKGGLLEVVSNADGIAGTVMGLFPSSWGARIVVDFAQNAGNIHVPDTLAGLAALMGFLVASLWLGLRAADHAYSLEQTPLSASTVRPDGHFYGALKGLGGGGSFGTLVVSVFKDYGRRLQNISNIAYILGMLVLIGIFAAPGTGDEVGPLAGVMSALFLFPIMVIMATGDVTVQGKDNLFIYRKAPLGVDGYLRAMLVKGWIVMVPLAAITGGFLTAGQAQGLVVTSLMVLIVAAEVALILGLFMLNPAFSEKSPRIWVNIMIAIGLQALMTVLSIQLIVVSRGGLGETAPLAEYPALDLVSHMMGHLALVNWSFAGAFYLIGKRCLCRME